MAARSPSHPKLEFDLVSFADLCDLDFDDEPDTTMEATPYCDETLAPPTHRASFVRIRTPVAPEDVARSWAKLQDEQLNLMVDVVCLEHAVREVERAAPRSSGLLRRWVADLQDLRASVSDVLAERGPGSLWSPNAPLGVYMTGLFVWSGNVIAVLSELASSLVRRRVDWNEARSHLAAASLTYFDGLEEEIHVELDVLQAGDVSRQYRVDELRAAVDELLWYGWWLERSLRLA
jgi:hypothetical protein